MIIGEEKPSVTNVWITAKGNLALRLLNNLRDLTGFAETLRLFL